jgi:hypothetical protein
MNPTNQLDFQPDLHPDADTLSAFLERQLAPPEREQTLAHLATCGRCRQITFLARQAAEADETATASTRPTSASQMPGPRWQLSRLIPNWQFATLAAAAGCSLLALSVWFYSGIHANHTEASAPRISSARPETAPVQTPTPPSPTPIQAAPEAQMRKSAPAVINKPLLRQPSPQPPIPTLQAPSARPPAPTALGNSMAFSPARQLPAPSQALSVPGTPSLPVTASASPEPLVGSVSETVTVQTPNAGIETIPDSPVTTTINAQQVAPLPVNGRNLDALAKRSPGAASPNTAKTTTAAGGTLHRQATGHATAATGASIAGLQLKAGLDAPADSDAALATTAMQARLPSGLAPTATAAAQSRVLAIDSNGSLFLSTDAARTWEQIVPQWTGRLVQVRVSKPRLTPTPPRQPANPAAGAAASAAQPASPTAAVPSPPAALIHPPAHFEVVTDQGAILTSPDGRSWFPAPVVHPQ